MHDSLCNFGCSHSFLIFFFLFPQGSSVVLQYESTSETHYPTLTVAWKQGGQPAQISLKQFICFTLVLNWKTSNLFCGLQLKNKFCTQWLDSGSLCGFQRCPVLFPLLPLSRNNHDSLAWLSSYLLAWFNLRHTKTHYLYCFTWVVVFLWCFTMCLLCQFIVCCD